jgi:hypothetical protein
MVLPMIEGLCKIDLPGSAQATLVGHPKCSYVFWGRQSSELRQLSRVCLRVLRRVIQE